MGSKGAFLFLGLILAIFLIISSEVAARELAETSNEMNGSNISETKRVGKHLRKGLGKIIKAGKEIFCNRCSTCNGLCGYCCN